MNSTDNKDKIMQSVAEQILTARLERLAVDPEFPQHLRAMIRDNLSRPEIKGATLVEPAPTSAIKEGNK